VSRPLGSFLPRLPFPEQRPQERIDRDSLASVKKALTRRGLDLTSIGLRGPERLAHLNRRLQLCLDREEEARSEARLVRVLRQYGISFVTPGIVGDERNCELARRVFERRERDRIRGLAQAKMEAWRRVSGDSPTASPSSASPKRMSTMQEYNRAKYTKLLDVALAKSNYPEIERLCKLGADANHMTRGGHVALHQGATFDRAEFVRVMIEDHGADPEMCAKNGHSPLTVSAAFGHIRTMRALVAAGADVNREAAVRKTPLMCAAEADRQGAVQALLLMPGCSINAQTRSGETALLAAVSAGREHMVQFLLNQCGADMYAEDKDGEDAYHRAKAERQHRIQAWLRSEILREDPLAFVKGQAGSYQEKDIRRSPMRRRQGGDDGGTAASRPGQTSQPQPLDQHTRRQQLTSPRPLKATVAPSAKSATRGERAMAIAIAGNDFEAILEIIKQRRAHVDMESYKVPSRDTALMRASWYGRLEEMDLLLALGADVNHHVSPSGRTALMSAASNNKPEAISALLSWGAHINAEDAEGWTAAMVAGHAGHVPALQRLVEHGAAVRHQSKLGATAFIVAAAANRANTAGVLMSDDISMISVEDSVGRLVRRTTAASGMSEGNEDLMRIVERRPKRAEARNIQSGMPAASDNAAAAAAANASSPSERRFNDMGIATNVSQQLNEKMLLELEKLFEEEAMRKRVLSKGRRKAVSTRRLAAPDGIDSPKAGVRHGAGKRLRDPTFTYSLQHCEGIVEDIRMELGKAQKQARIMVQRVEESKRQAERERLLNRRGDEPGVLERDGYPDDEPECFKRPAELTLAAFYTKTKQLDKARELLDRLLRMQRERYGEDSIVLAGTHNAFASLFARAGGEGAVESALARYKHARRLLASRHGPLHPHIVSTDRMIVTLLTREERYDEALAETAAIEKLRRRKVDRHHPLAVDVNAMAKAVAARAETLSSKRAADERKRLAEEKVRAAAIAADRGRENVHPEAYEIENAEWFKSSLHEDPEFKSVFTSYCKKYQTLPTLRLYWRLDAFRHLAPKSEDFHRELQFIVTREIRATRHGFLTRGMREVIFGRIEKINLAEGAAEEGGSMAVDPTRIFDEARVQAFLMLHGQFQQFLRNTRGQRWLRRRISDRDGQTAKGVVPMQALARRMIALGSLPRWREERARRDGGAMVCSPALLDVYEWVMRKHKEVTKGVLAIQSVVRGRNERKRYCRVVSAVFKEVKQGEGVVFWVDSRRGTYLGSEEPVCAKRCRRRFGEGWRELRV
jgi:ankyrin repeat protein